MNKVQLLLITDGYPYGDAEPYLETEMIYLSEKFDRVIVVPITDMKSPCRAVPDNVLISPIETSSLEFNDTNKFEFTVRFLREIVPEIYLYWKVNKCFPRRAFFWMMIAALRKTIALKNALKTVLVETEIQCGSCVLYSYWAAEGAITLSMLKDEYPEISVVSRAHGWDCYFERSSIGYLPFRPLLFRNINQLYSVSGKGAGYLDVKTGHKYSAKIDVRYLGVDSCAAFDVQERYDDTFRMVSCSRLVPLKRVDRIVEVLRLVSQYPNVRNIEWCHIGGGPLYGRIISKCEASDFFNGSVSFKILGDIDNSAVKKYYKNNAVDLFISLSETEGLPVSMMEAASFGVPILSTDVGGVKEIVRNNFNGWLVPLANNNRQVAQLIYDLVVEEKDVFKQFGDNSRLHWSENFDASRNYLDWAEELHGMACNCGVGKK